MQGLKLLMQLHAWAPRHLLLTLHVDRIGLMPCNPAIGGIGKGHIVFEISALGGLMPQLCTQTYLQARMLNTSKGPAVHGLRLQIDKHAYSKLSKQMLEQTVTIRSGMVDEILLDARRLFKESVLVKEILILRALSLSPQEHF